MLFQAIFHSQGKAFSRDLPLYMRLPWVLIVIDFGLSFGSTWWQNWQLSNHFCNLLPEWKPWNKSWNLWQVSVYLRDNRPAFRFRIAVQHMCADQSTLDLCPVPFHSPHRDLLLGFYRSMCRAIWDVELSTQYSILHPPIHISHSRQIAPCHSLQKMFW